MDGVFPGYWCKILTILKLYPATILFCIKASTFNRKGADGRLGFNWKIADTVYGLARIKILVLHAHYSLVTF
jgi:hypothetical protein